MITEENKILKDQAKQFAPLLQKIKLCLFDIDGVLSDGKLYWGGEELGFIRTGHAQDGQGIRYLIDKGLMCGVISGGDGPSLQKRYRDVLKLPFVYLGNDDKMIAFKDIMAKTNLHESEVLYMGDDMIDLPLLRKVGFAATVPHSPIEVQELAHYISKREGGDGAVREVIELLRLSRGWTYPW